MNTADTIENSLKNAFQPELLEVINDSHKHAGHLGDNGTGETHYTIRISASAFNGKTRVEREKLARGAIAAAVKTMPHALSFKFV